MRIDGFKHARMFELPVLGEHESPHNNTRKVRDHQLVKFLCFHQPRESRASLVAYKYFWTDTRTLPTFAERHSHCSTVSSLSKNRKWVSTRADLLCSAQVSLYVLCVVPSLQAGMRVSHCLNIVLSRVWRLRPIEALHVVLI